MLSRFVALSVSLILKVSPLQGGHDHSSVGDIYAYIANCFGNGYKLKFVNNTCILNYQPDATHVGGYSSDCGLAPGMEVHGNTVATPGGSLLACGTFLNDWVAAGHDKGTKSVQWPRDVRLSATFGCVHSLTAVAARCRRT